MKESVRLRADPSLIRVAFRRRTNGLWECCITERSSGRMVRYARRDPEDALEVALRNAADADYVGIDLDLIHGSTVELVSKVATG